jgi:hypothetical protein
VPSPFIGHSRPPEMTCGDANVAARRPGTGPEPPCRSTATAPALGATGRCRPRVLCASDQAAAAHARRLPWAEDSSLSGCLPPPHADARGRAAGLAFLLTVWDPVTWPTGSPRRTGTERSSPCGTSTQPWSALVIWVAQMSSEVGVVIGGLVRSYCASTVGAEPTAAATVHNLRLWSTPRIRVSFLARSVALW